MLTPIFTNARTAGAAGSFINLIFGLLFFAVAFVDAPIGAIWALNLLAPTGFAIALFEVSIYLTTKYSIAAFNYSSKAASIC